MTTSGETHTVDPLPSPVRPLASGTLLGGRFRLGPVLGRGGFGVVHQARDLRLEQDVALKLVHPARLQGASLERLRREVKLARAADSERLVDIFDLEQVDGHVFLVMELVVGQSLRQVLAEKAPLAVDRALELASELLLALVDLHAHSVLHRDIKPANVLVDDAGRLRLTDFGLARSLHQETQLTASGAMLGTAAYLFPERGHQLTPAADLYSFGVVLFEMLTGRLPFEADDPIDLLKLHLQEPPPRIRTLRPEVPHWVAEIVVRLLEKRPEDRFQSANEVLAAFGRRKRRRAIPWRSAIAAVALIVMISSGLWLKNLSIFSQSTSIRWAAADSGWADINQDMGVTVKADDGSVLGSLSPAADGASGFRFDSQRWVAVVRDAYAPGAGPPPYELSLYDSTLDINRVFDLPLTDAVDFFESIGFARTYGSLITVVDVDDDGTDELFLSLLHASQYPSTTALYEPARQRFREIFRTTGHHRVVGVVDLNNDGNSDVLIAGINNRLGYASVLAGLELWPAVREPGTPNSLALDSNLSEILYTGPGGSLLFYFVAPLGGCRPPDPDCLTILESERKITWQQSRTGGVIELDFDGLRLDSDSSLPREQRLGERERAYRLYRRATLKMRESPEQAFEDFMAGREAAHAAGDHYLATWFEMCAAVSRIESGAIRAGEATLASLLAGISDRVVAAELAFEAGRMLHRKDMTESAMRWYQHAYRLNHLEEDRARWELLQSMLLVHLENGKLGSASRLLDDFHRRHPSYRTLQESFRAYLDWLADELPRQIEVTPTSPDLVRYWALELRHLSLPDGQHSAMLTDLELELSRSSETRGALLARQAELHVDLGNNNEARTACSQAREWYATIGPRWIPARFLKSGYERRCAEVLTSITRSATDRSVNKSPLLQ